MRAAVIMNYEENGEDYPVGRIEPEAGGRVAVVLDGGEPRIFRNLNAALTAIREQDGLPNAYLI
ncbi:MAG: hypothetical protein Q4D82_04655 [Neisseria sp.]|nr:hypothetical protein [Neisseria sp.]